VSERKKPK